MAKLFSTGSYAAGMSKFPKLRSERNPHGTVYVQVLCMTADLYAKPGRGGNIYTYPDEISLHRRGMVGNLGAVISKT